MAAKSRRGSPDGATAMSACIRAIDWAIIASKPPGRVSACPARIIMPPPKTPPAIRKVMRIAVGAPRMVSPAVSRSRGRDAGRAGIFPTAPANRSRMRDRLARARLV